MSEGAGPVFWNADATNQEAAARVSERNGRAWRREAGTGSQCLRTPYPSCPPPPPKLCSSPQPLLYSGFSHHAVHTPREVSLA